MGALTDRGLLDPPALSAPRLAAIEDRSKALLGIERDLVHLQAEAVLALEAMARGIGAPGRTCLNIVTGPYGMEIGRWLEAAGAEVVELRIPFRRAVRPEEVAAALAQRPAVHAVAVVHAEAATGVVNPLAEIVAVAREHDALTLVDAVASVGGHPVPVEALDLDLCAFGPQKALAGPSGVSMVAVSDRAWDALRSAPAPWRGSILSLLDWKERWADPGREAIPGTPSALDLYALESACARLQAEGLERAIARHARAAAATRAGIVAMGLEPFVTDPADATTLVTTVRLPDGADPAALLHSANATFCAPLLGGAGPLFTELVRIDHLGQGAAPPTVVTALAALGGALAAQGLPVDVGAGVAAAVEAMR